jgi:hypothetical protein
LWYELASLTDSVRIYVQRRRWWLLVKASRKELLFSGPSLWSCNSTLSFDYNQIEFFWFLFSTVGIQF